MNLKWFFIVAIRSFINSSNLFLYPFYLLSALIFYFYLFIAFNTFCKLHGGTLLRIFLISHGYIWVSH